MKRISRNSLVDTSDYSVKEAVCIKSGESLIIETVTPEKKPNLTGPILVEGVEHGDTLAITIEKINLLNDGILFFASSNEPWGGLLSENAKAPLNKRVDIKDGIIHFSPEISFGIQPMVGWIALMNEAVGFDPCDHGGNMDIKELQEGTTLYLHDTFGKGKFLLGDVHAVMGDGEICGTGVEISADVIVKVDVIKNTQEHRPIILTKTNFVTVASRKSHEEASRQCVSDMVGYIMKSQGLSFEEANVFLSSIGDLRISSVVSHIKTYKMLVDRKFLKEIAELLITSRVSQ